MSFAITSKGLPSDLALLVSCVARKLAMKQRIEEENEAVRGMFGADTSEEGECWLHNQTMTITALAQA